MPVSVNNLPVGPAGWAELVLDTEIEPGVESIDEVEELVSDVEDGAAVSLLVDVDEELMGAAVSDEVEPDVIIVSVRVADAWTARAFR